MLTEKEIESLGRIIMYSFESYTIDFAGWANTIRNMTDSLLLNNTDVQNYASQDTFVRGKFEGEDIMRYIYVTIRSLKLLLEEMDADHYKKSPTVKTINDWFNIVELYNMEMAKHGDLSGV